MPSGDLGRRLREPVTVGSRLHRFARAVQTLRDHYLEPLGIDAPTGSLHMSVSSLHHQFKAAAIGARITVSPARLRKRRSADGAPPSAIPQLNLYSNCTASSRPTGL